MARVNRHSGACLHSIAVLLTSAILLTNGTAAAAKSHRQPANNTPGSFDYYLLTLSWAPEFCATHASSASSSECSSAHHYGFVVHGLWPENEDGSYPEHCTSAHPVAQDIVRQMLPIMPDSGLIQHEWSTHGTCSSLDASTYFGDIKKAYSQLKIPVEYLSPTHPVRISPSEIERKFASANGAPVSSFRISCSGPEFVAIEVCLTKELQYRQCGSGVRECRAPQTTLLPPKQ